MKKICIDLSAMNLNYRGGVNTYIHGILSGLEKTKFKNKIFILCTHECYKKIKIYKSKNFFFLKVNSPKKIYNFLIKLSILINSSFFFKFFSNLKWQKITNLIDQYADLVYIPTTILNGFNGVKPRILSIHDIQHKHYPENFKLFELRARNISYFLSVKNAHSIQASSEFIKKDLLKNYFFLKKKIFVIREGIDIKKFKKKNNFKEKLKLPNKYIFYPAQLWPHKDHITILKALKMFPIRHKIKLVFTGTKLSAYENIKKFINENHLNQKVKILGLVSLNKLKTIYKKAFTVVIAAKYESSSLPILEAASFGVPIIASDTKPNKELKKFLNISLFKVSNPYSLKEKILNLENNIKLRTHHFIKNKNLIKKFDWYYVVNQYFRYFNSI